MVLGLVALMAMGVSLESSGGWVACPPLVVVEVERDEGGVYHVWISGEFEIHVDGNVELYKRIVLQAHI